MENAMVTVRGKVSFPSLVQPDQMSGKYSVQICNLSDRAVEALEELGVEPKFKDDTYGRGRFVTPSSKFPIDNSKYLTIVDDQGLALDPAVIGPGSVVKATLKAYEWKMGGKSGVGVRLMKMQVEELAEPEASLSVADEDVL